MKKQDKISVIIPCYNTEKYLDRCIKSIFNQTYKNFEVILIDDFSSDDTWNIITKYSKKYDNIIGIRNDENKGAGYSRNKAIKYATSEYISFIDSDDFIEDNFFEELYNSLISEKSDVAVCDINISYENSDEPDIRSMACTDSDDRLSYINNGLAASPCNKMFKKSLLVKYPFAEHIMNEDIPCVLSVLTFAKKISYVSNTSYTYIQRNNSIQNSSFSFKRFDIFDSVELFFERIKTHKQYNEIRDIIVFNQLLVMLFYVIPRVEKFNERWKILREYCRRMKKYNVNKNQYYHSFLIEQGMKHRLYYKTIVSFTDMGLSFLASFMISFYKFYSKYFVKEIVKKDITMNDLVKLAIKQSKMKNNKKTISVVVPNYNYEQYLFERLYSILYQQVKIDEIIILDDCSKDNSRKLIDKIVKNLKKYINIRSVYNEENSGSAFKQWEKGFSLAKSDYVWIAEADDYCDKRTLKNMLKPILENDNIVISYVDTAFIDKEGKIFLRTIKPEIDIMKTGHWNSNFINDGKDEFNNYTFLNCTIANVSSALIKNDDYTELFELSGKYKQAGDWLFYANLMHKGYVAFYNKPLNYYRVHGNNVSSVTKKEAHIKEIMNIHDYYDKTYGLNKKQKTEIEKRYKFLKKVWGLK